ncbi:MAG: FecR domain-containing protein [Gammaproteobacteria bacterium]
MLSRTTVCTSLEPVGSQTLLALALVCAFVFSAQPAFAAPPAAESILVVSMQGDVRVTARNQARAVKPGAIVAPPATIRTGRDGVIELRQGSTTVSVAADTQIDIAASSSADGLLERVVQPKGNVFYDVGKRKAKKLRIETPYLVAVIKGTQFNVAAQDESATVSLFEGHLEIWTPDDSDVVQLNAGEIATRGRNDRTIRVLRMDTGETIRARNDASSDGTDSRLSASVTGGVLSDDRPGLVDAERPDTLVPIAGSTNVASDLAANSSAALQSAKSAIDSPLDASVGIGSAGASVTASADIDAVESTVGIEAGLTGAAATVDAGAGVAVDPGAGAVSAGVDAGVDLGGVAAASVDTAATVDLASASVDVGASAAVVDVPVAVDAAVSLDSSPAVDVGVAVDLGTATIETPPVVPTVVDEVVAPLLRGPLGQ